jgi:hypothetical protein
MMIFPVAREIRRSPVERVCAVLTLETLYSDTKDKATMTTNTDQMDYATAEQDIQDAAACLAAAEEDNW